MLRALKEFWLGSAPVEFESAYGLAESVERLRAASKRSVFSALAKQEAVGTVKESRVSLQRTIPLVGNSFKPFFQGRFTQKGGRTVLVGRFVTWLPVRIFMAIWFGCIVCFSAISAFAAILHSAQAASGALFGLLMLAGGAGLVALGRWFARNDAAWLSGVICGALYRQRPTPEGAIRSGTDSQAMSVVALVLAAMGASQLAIAVIGLESFQPDHGPPMFSRFGETGMRDIMAIWGAALLLLALGVYQRRVLAWRAFFLMLAAGWAWTLLNLPDSGLPPAMPVIFGLMMLVVMAFWGRWWYAQRSHFNR